MSETRKRNHKRITSDDVETLGSLSSPMAVSSGHSRARKSRRRKSSAITAAKSSSNESKAASQPKTKASCTKTEPSNKSGNYSYTMRMILSPAKTLNLDKDADGLPLGWTQPLLSLQSQRTQVVAALKNHASSSTKLGALLKTSAKISTTAKGYWEDMSKDGASHPVDQRKPAIMTFAGFAYAGLEVRDQIAEEPKALRYLQDHLRIVDPLYGWLRPMDAIEAYRLEMASKGVFDNDDSMKCSDVDKKLALHNFWKPSIKTCLLEETNEVNEGNNDDNKTPILIVNLASDEYSVAVDHPYNAKIVFRSGGRTVAVHAKRARGLMVRYAALHGIETVEGLQAFDSEGYSYQPEASTWESSGGMQGLMTMDDTPKTSRKKKKPEPPTLVFDRPGTWKKSS